MNGGVADMRSFPEAERAAYASCGIGDKHRSATIATGLAPIEIAP